MNTLLPPSTSKKPSGNPKQPHPLILFVILPLLLVLVLLLVLQTSVLFLVPLWVVWVSGGLIFMYSLFYDIRMQLQWSNFTVKFTNSTIFHEHFTKQMQRIGFDAKQNMLDHYTFILSTQPISRYGIRAIFPSRYFQIEMHVMEGEAVLTGSKIAIDTTKRLLRQQIQQEQNLVLPY